MDFESIREYQPGDDIRAIEWNVTARSNSAFVKEFREERELIVLFLVDISASGAFGSARRSKLDAVIEMAALLMFSALRNNDRVGMLTFCDRVLDYSPPRKGKGNVLRLIRQLVALEPVASPTNLEAPLEFISGGGEADDGPLPGERLSGPGRAAGGHCAGVSVASAKLSSPFGGDVRRAMAVCKKRHDLIAVSISDPREHQLPDVGILSLRDAETGEIVKFDARSAKVRELFAGYAARRYNESRPAIVQDRDRPIGHPHGRELRVQPAAVLPDAAAAVPITGRTRCQVLGVRCQRGGEQGMWGQREFDNR